MMSADFEWGFIMSSRPLSASALCGGFAILCSACNDRTFVVTSTSPTQNQTNVATNAIVTVNFDRERSSYPGMDVNPDAGFLEAFIRRAPDGIVMNIFSIRSQSGFAPLTAYTVTVSDSDDDGKPFELHFTTGDAADTTPPAAVTDLSVIPGSITRTGLQLTWTASGDDGTIGTATVYDLRVETSDSCPLTAESFDGATSVPTAPPQSAGARETATVEGLSPGTAYCFALVVEDGALNDSALSNGVAAGTVGP